MNKILKETFWGTETRRPCVWFVEKIEPTKEAPEQNVSVLMRRINRESVESANNADSTLHRRLAA